MLTNKDVKEVVKQLFDIDFNNKYKINLDKIFKPEILENVKISKIENNIVYFKTTNASFKSKIKIQKKSIINKINKDNLNLNIKDIDVNIVTNKNF